MLKTTITWYKPEEKTPENGEVLTLSDTGNITILSVYDGHFNCRPGISENEIENIILWAEIPQKLEEEAGKAWHEKRREEIEKNV